MTAAAFCYQNLFDTSTITVSSEATGFDKENSYNWTTFDFWKPTAGGTSWINIDTRQYYSTATGGGINYIVLDAGASAVTDAYKDMSIVITAGTGSGQTRTITTYSGGAKTAFVTPDWSTNPDATSEFTIYKGTVDYGAVFAHDLHTQGATIKLKYSNNNLTTDINTAWTVAPSTSAPIVRTFSSIAKPYWRFEITNATAAQAIGVLALGARLDMEQGVRTGFAPPTFARTPHVMPHQSQNGAFLGMSVKRRGVEFNASFNAVTPAWLRSNWGTFQDHFETKPFFFTWDAVSHKNEAVFCWANGIQSAPVYSQEKFISINMNMVGLYL